MKLITIPLIKSFLKVLKTKHRCITKFKVEIDENNIYLNIRNNINYTSITWIELGKIKFTILKFQLLKSEKAPNQN